MYSEKAWYSRIMAREDRARIMEYTMLGEKLLSKK